jgi:hypothetical protein
VQELDDHGNVIASSTDKDRKKQSKKTNAENNRSLITPNRVALAAGGLAGLGALGYLAYNQATASNPTMAIPGQAIAQASANIVPTLLRTPILSPSAMQGIILPAASTAATPIVQAATNAATNIATPLLSQASSMVGQNVYQWVATNSINPFH